MNNRFRRCAISALLPLLLALGLAPIAIAVDSDPIKDRQDAMEGIGEAMKTLSAMAKKQAPFDAGVVESSAGMIAMHLEAAKTLFPAGSDKGAHETWAKAEIWAHPEDFQAKLQAAHAAALELAKVTAEAAFPVALGKLGGACKSCHESYRRPKD